MSHSDASSFEKMLKIFCICGFTNFLKLLGSVNTSLVYSHNGTIAFKCLIERMANQIQDIMALLITEEKQLTKTTTWLLLSIYTVSSQFNLS